MHESTNAEINALYAEARALRDEAASELAHAKSQAAKSIADARAVAQMPTLAIHGNGLPDGVIPFRRS